jgi:hypothetical protein
MNMAGDVTEREAREVAEQVAEEHGDSATADAPAAAAG